MRAEADSPAALSTRVLDFFADLRETHGFTIGQSETLDALRALDVLGISDRRRMRAALRAVACASREQIAVFETAYDEVFLARDEGTEQSAYAPRHSRPGAEAAPNPSGAAEERAGDPRDEDDGDGGEGPARERRLTSEPNDALDAWMSMRARYSPIAAAGEPPAIDVRGIDAMESAARAFVRSIRLGRARRWTAQLHGPRFDVRRTMRSSLQTGGDPVVLHRLGPPRRAPRIVLLVDGSRSMADHAPVMLQFAYALERATRRARTFAFSTELHDITRSLQAARPGDVLPRIGDAWGGGTRIGASLARFVRDYGARVLDTQTLVLIASDGLDVGDVLQLTRAMAEIRRRSAGIVWLNPNARSAGFTPTSTGMRAVAPYIAFLEAATNAEDFERTASRLARGAGRSSA